MLRRTVAKLREHRSNSSEETSENPIQLTDSVIDVMGLTVHTHKLTSSTYKKRLVISSVPMPETYCSFSSIREMITVLV